MSNQNLTSTPMDINNNTQDTYQGAFEIFSWGNTHSTLSSLRPPSTRIPPAGERNSAFLDLSRMPTGIDGREIASNLPTEMIGTKFRADTKFIQIFFEGEDEADRFINRKTLDLQNYKIPILPPKGKLPSTMLLRMDNVPIMERNKLESAINLKLAEMCCPVEVAPVVVKGTKWLTSRWEAVVKAIPDHNLKTTLRTIINIDDNKVIISWSGSPATCIQCSTVGHIRKDCPKRVKPTTTPKQKNTPPQQKIAPNNSKQTYANIVTQEAPEVQGAIAEETMGTDQGPVYEGPTSLNDPTPEDKNTDLQNAEQMQAYRPETPGLNQTSVPIYDERSPFNQTTDAQPNKKRHTYSSPTGSPRKPSSTNLLPSLMDVSDNGNTNPSLF